ncbi:hypothetical protein [Natronorubrum daqingense]|uniref:Uncharacterized protein n=1 Tax=Natronorubrum daqingense TaxID=588898 RepID=A0A1N7G5K4_9EURY|nr:hypothetical protein [Natronorubrum daqingense]APX98711.1 hypothetical protein BB347_18565 [Natronorubrum daqingense]SIS07880.1 hypothetical protein SAMN05421809_3748 [Natronorubrum daqingense]
MSIETDAGRTAQIGPLARLREGEVLRCRDDRTGWTWYYDVVEGETRKYHAYHEFDGRALSDLETVSETVAYERVDERIVSERQLAVLRGDEQ